MEKLKPFEALLEPDTRWANLVLVDRSTGQFRPIGLEDHYQALSFVNGDLKLTHWGCGGNLGLVYDIIPRLCLYSSGLREPRESLIRFSLYQRT